jgi:hypothetical protein
VDGDSLAVKSIEEDVGVDTVVEGVEIAGKQGDEDTAASRLVADFDDGSGEWGGKRLWDRGRAGRRCRCVL